MSKNFSFDEAFIEVSWHANTLVKFLDTKNERSAMYRIENYTPIIFNLIRLFMEDTDKFHLSIAKCSPTNLIRLKNITPDKIELIDKLTTVGLMENSLTDILAEE